MQLQYKHNHRSCVICIIHLKIGQQKTKIFKNLIRKNYFKNLKSNLSFATVQKLIN